MIINIIQEIEKSDVMKKKILFIVGGIIVAGLLIWGGRTFYLTQMVNYKAAVEDAIDTYSYSEQVSDLAPIADLFKKYKNHEKIKDEIQAYSYELVNEWYEYLINKYVCDLNNVNSCKLMLSELEDFEPKIDKLYNYREIDGYTVISKNTYTNLMTKLDKKIKEIDAIIKDPSATRPLNEAEIKDKKCNATSVCSNCRDGVCTCTYTNEDGSKEDLTCKKDM